MAYFYNSLMYKLCKIYVWNRREDHFFQRNIRWTLVKLIFYLIEMNDSNSFRLLPSGEKMIVPMSFRLKGWLNLKEYQISTLFYRPPHENWICTPLHFSKKKNPAATQFWISLGDSTVDNLFHYLRHMDICVLTLILTHLLLSYLASIQSWNSHPQRNSLLKKKITWS